MFTGHSLAPRLFLEPSSDLEGLTLIAQQAMPHISPAYRWCGIFDADDKWVREITFEPELKIEISEIKVDINIKTWKPV